MWKEPEVRTMFWGYVTVLVLGLGFSIAMGLMGR
jgi:hypothetical protein